MVPEYHTYYHIDNLFDNLQGDPQNMTVKRQNEHGCIDLCNVSPESELNPTKTGLN